VQTLSPAQVSGIQATLKKYKNKPSMYEQCCDEIEDTYRVAMKEGFNSLCSNACHKGLVATKAEIIRAAAGGNSNGVDRHIPKEQQRFSGQIRELSIIK